MGVKMIADNRKKPSLARRKVVKAERAAELDRIVQEELRAIQIANSVRWQPGHLDAVLGN